MAALLRARNSPRTQVRCGSCARCALPSTRSLRFFKLPLNETQCPMMFLAWGLVPRFTRVRFFKLPMAPKFPDNALGGEDRPMKRGTKLCPSVNFTKIALDNDLHLRNYPLADCLRARRSPTFDCYGEVTVSIFTMTRNPPPPRSAEVHA